MTGSDNGAVSDEVMEAMARDKAVVFDDANWLMKAELFYNDARSFAGHAIMMANQAAQTATAQRSSEVKLLCFEGAQHAREAANALATVASARALIAGTFAQLAVWCQMRGVQDGETEPGRKASAPGDGADTEEASEAAIPLRFPGRDSEVGVVGGSPETDQEAP